MARRAGLTHGIATFVLAALGVAAAVGVLVSIHGIDAVARMMHRADLPVTRNDWKSNTGLTIGVACGAAMLLGSVWGALRGDRWHGRLVTRVAGEPPPPVDVEQRVTGALVLDEAAVRDGRAGPEGRELSPEEERELAREKR